MSSNSNIFCNLCKYSNSHSFLCPHNNRNATDVNQAMPILIPDINLNPMNHGNQGLQEFQFFGNDDALTWLFNDSSSKATGNEGGLQQQQTVNYNYLALEGGFRNSCNQGRLTFDVCFSGTTSSPDSMIGQSTPVEVPTTSNVVSGKSSSG